MTACAVLLVTGPPGAGKTTLARRLSESADAPTVHLQSDDFFNAIRTGFIAPWLPEAHPQNVAVTSAIVAAATAYATGGFPVIIDGVVGPRFVGPYRDAGERLGVGLDYLVLRPQRAAAVARARDRTDAPLPDYPPGMYEEFVDLGDLEPHAIDTTHADVETLLAEIRAGVASGRFRLR